MVIYNFFHCFVRTDGKAHLNTKVPDTITTWVASAFAMHHEKGLGITEHTSEVNHFDVHFKSFLFNDRWKNVFQVFVHVCMCMCASS